MLQICFENTLTELYSKIVLVISKYTSHVVDQIKLKCLTDYKTDNHRMSEVRGYQADYVKKVRGKR